VEPGFEKKQDKKKREKTKRLAPVKSVLPVTRSKKAREAKPVNEGAYKLLRA